MACPYASSITPRQGAFRLLVTDAYQRRCAVTGERTLPVLGAAHIRPHAELGPHKLENGREYYALAGSSVRMPLPPAPPPSAEYLEWHRDTIFRQ